MLDKIAAVSCTWWVFTPTLLGIFHTISLCQFSNFKAKFLFILIKLGYLRTKLIKIHRLADFLLVIWVIQALTLKKYIPNWKGPKIWIVLIFLRKT